MTAINGMNLGPPVPPAETKGTQSPTVWGEGATFRAHQRIVALTLVLMELHTTPTLTPITAAPHHCWPPLEAERAGSARHLPGTAPPKGGAECWSGHLLQPSLLDPQEKGWRERVGLHQRTFLSETQAPTA